jgi:hypothetical protein
MNSSSIAGAVAVAQTARERAARLTTRLDASPDSSGCFLTCIVRRSRCIGIDSRRRVNSTVRALTVTWGRTETWRLTASSVSPFPWNAYRSGRRFLRTDSSWPVFFRLPTFPVKPTRTSSSNSPPIFSLHATHTSVSGSVRRRAGGIGVPHCRQSRDSSFIRTIPSESNPGVEKASEPLRGLQERKSWWGCPIDHPLAR